MDQVIDECELCADFELTGRPDPMFDLDLRPKLHMVGNVRIDKWNESLLIESVRGALIIPYVFIARFEHRLTMSAILNVKISADNRLGKCQERFRVQQSTGSG